MKDKPHIKIISIPGDTARDRTLWVKNYMADRDGMDRWRVDLMPDIYRSSDGKRCIVVSGPRSFKESYEKRNLYNKV